MGLEKPVLSGAKLPFNMREVGTVTSTSSYTLNGYYCTSLEPLNISVDFTPALDKFYIILGDGVIALGSTSTTNNTIYFHVKNLTETKKSYSFNGLTVYECSF